MALGRNTCADLVATAALNFIFMMLYKLCVLQCRVMSRDSVCVLLPEDYSGPCPLRLEGGIKSVLTVLHCSQGEQLEAIIKRQYSCRLLGAVSM